MSVARPAQLAWSLAGACVALVLSSLVLLLAVSHAGDVSQYYYEDAAVAVAFALLGAVVAAHRPDNPIGWLFLAIGLSGALGVVSNEYVNYTLATAPGTLPGGPVAAWLSAWTWWPAYGLVPLVLLIFPDGRLPSPRWRWAAWLAAGGVAVMTLGIAASTLDDPVQFALSEEEPGGLPALVLAVSVIAAAVSFLAALVSLVLRWRRAWGNEREQLKWVAFTGALALAANLVLQIFQLPGLGLVGVVLVPVGAAIAILRYRLYDIDRIISRTLAYGLLTALLGMVYVAGVFGFGRLLNPGGQPSELAVAASTLAVAALFQPARRRVQAAVDRRFNRARYDAARTVETFSARLRDEIDLDTLSTELLAVINQAMQPTRVSLWLRPNAPGSRVHQER
jgi:ABC-type multidrug transport system fused ATPase/permease subunit